MIIDRYSIDFVYFKNIGYEDEDADELARSIQNYLKGYIPYDELYSRAKIRYDMTKNVVIEN